MIIIENFLTPEDVDFCLSVLKVHEAQSARTHLPLEKLEVVLVKVKYQVEELLGSCTLGTYDDKFSFMRYPTGSWLFPHSDLNLAKTDYRERYSLVIHLNEGYTGGRFVHDGNIGEHRKTGTAVIFDDTKIHSVSQIFSGERVVMVIYAFVS